MEFVSLSAELFCNRVNRHAISTLEIVYLCEPSDFKLDTDNCIQINVSVC